jgi:hypothetical protein
MKKMKFIPFSNLAGVLLTKEEIIVNQQKLIIILKNEISSLEELLVFIEI